MLHLPWLNSSTKGYMFDVYPDGEGLYRLNLWVEKQRRAIDEQIADHRFCIDEQISVMVQNTVSRLWPTLTMREHHETVIRFLNPTWTQERVENMAAWHVDHESEGNYADEIDAWFDDIEF